VAPIVGNDPDLNPFVKLNQNKASSIPLYVVPNFQEKLSSLSSRAKPFSDV